MTTPHDAPPAFGQYMTWAQPVQQLPASWDTCPVRIAEITIDGPTVITPRGDIDRSTARWFLGDRVPYHSSAPTWAKAAAVLLAIPTCLVSLLLLLVKETDVWTSKLMVSSGGTAFSTTVYSRNEAQHEGIRSAIAWARATPESPVTGQMALPS